MTQQEWENATEEERNAEIERCRTDSHYLYMTYYWKEGMKTYSKDDWDSMVGGFTMIPSRRIRKFNPLDEYAKTIQKLPDFIKPNERAYDGSAMRLNWEFDPDEPFPIPISLLKTDPEKYLELVEKRKKLLEEMWDGFKPKLKDRTVGKIMITSTVDTNDRVDFKNIWLNSDPDNIK